MINSVSRAASPKAIAAFNVEPHVIAGRRLRVLTAYRPRRLDLVHWFGRWMYRLIVESLLGLRLEVDKLRFAPCFPTDDIAVLQTGATKEGIIETVDGVERNEMTGRNTGSR